MAQQTLGVRANKVVAFIFRVSRKIKFLDNDMPWILFEHLVKAILTYGSEICGRETHYCIEMFRINILTHNNITRSDAQCGCERGMWKVPH